MNHNRYFSPNTEEFFTIGIPFHTFLVVSIILMGLPPMIASIFRGRDASNGPTLPDKLSLVYIVSLVLAVMFAPKHASYTTNILRIESNSPPCVLFDFFFIYFLHYEMCRERC